MNYTTLAFTDFPLLASLQLLPLLMGLILLRLRGRLAVQLAFLTTIGEFLLTVYLYLQFDKTLAGTQFQFAEHLPLWGGLHYQVGVDSISVFFLLLCAILGFMAMVFIILRHLQNSAIFAILLLIQATLVSQFVTLNLLWFFLMSVIELILVAYLSLNWATSLDARLMMTRFIQFMSVGLLLLALGTFMLGWLYMDNSVDATWSFSLLDLSQLSLSPTLATVVFFLLFYSFAIRIPLFPLHGWLPIFVEQGNIAVAPIFLLGVKIGLYGLLRFVLPILPEAVMIWQNTIVAFATVGVFYAALLAMQQTNLRRLLAFAVISHTSLLIIGLFSLNHAGFLGSIFLALNFGLAISSLLSLTGLIWERTRTFILAKLGNLYQYIPVAGIAFLIASLAIVGMPGTPGFEGVHFLLEASVKQFGALTTIAAAIGNVITAGFLLRAFQLIFLKPVTDAPTHWNQSAMQAPEYVLAIIVIVITLGVGFFPEPWIELIDGASREMAHFYQSQLTVGHLQ